MKGARTPVWLATDPTGQASTGKYFERCREVRCRFVENKGHVAALEVACGQCGTPMEQAAAWTLKASKLLGGAHCNSLKAVN